MIGGFQVQPTLRPEDVLVAGTLPGWWWLVMIRKSKFGGRCVFIFICFLP